MKLKSIHLLVLLAMCWGPSFLFIKLALLQLDPVLLSVFRIGIGALVLNVVLLLRKDFLPKDLKFWKASAVAAFFSVAFPFMLINWGQQFIDSSLGALLNGTTPFFTVIFSFLLLQSEPIPANKVRGITLGFLGLIVLVFPNLIQGIHASLTGIAAIVLASASYGVGWVWVKKHLTSIPSFKAPAAQLLIATLYLLPFTFFTEQGIDLNSLNLVTISSIVALGVLGTAIAFILYFRLIAQAGPSYASMVTYLVPVIGVVLGIIVLNETLTPWMLAGATMILFGIYLGNKPKRATSKPDCVDLQVLSKVR